MSEAHAGHEHEHEHSHQHDHGHEHGHDHEHAKRTVFQLENAQVSFVSHVHDMASTVSVAIEPEPGAAIPFGSLVESMRLAARKLEDAGGIVGHIKAFGKTEDAFAHASVTAAGLEPTFEGDPALQLGSESDVQLVVIAMLVELDVVESITRECLESCL